MYCFYVDYFHRCMKYVRYLHVHIRRIQFVVSWRWKKSLHSTPCSRMQEVVKIYPRTCNTLTFGSGCRSSITTGAFAAALLPPSHDWDLCSVLIRSCKHRRSVFPSKRALRTSMRSVYLSQIHDHSSEYFCPKGNLHLHNCLKSYNVRSKVLVIKKTSETWTFLSI